MTSYIQTIELDVDKKKAHDPIYAKQGDIGSRFIRVTLLKDNTKLFPGNGATAKFRAVKPDGNSVINPAVINQDGTITVELTEQTLAIKGIVTADIVICDGNEKELSSVPFTIEVDEAPIGENISSSNELLELRSMIAAWEEQIADFPEGFAQLNNLLQNAGNASGSAELLDIRVARDGTCYDTAGNAVRHIGYELDDLKEDMDEIEEQIPTKTSQLTNDSYYQTALDVQTAVNNEIGNINALLSII